MDGVRFPRWNLPLQLQGEEGGEAKGEEESGTEDKTDWEGSQPSGLLCMGHIYHSPLTHVQLIWTYLTLKKKAYLKLTWTNMDPEKTDKYSV
jgi:hypothetical protein